MLRFYSSNGPVLGPLAQTLGPVHYLSPDSSGGVLGVAPFADHTAEPTLSSISGLYLLPSDPGIVIPATIFNSLPAALITQYGILATDTIRVILGKIHNSCNVCHWNPNFL